MAPAANQIVNGNGAGARGPQPGAAPQPDRGTMLARISHALGVHVAVITKITGKEPTYQMELEGGVRLEFPSFAKFIDQGYVRNTIGAVTNRLVPKIKGKVWEEIVQIMLAALVEKEGGEETDFLGSATLQVVNYLSQTDFIESPVAEAPQFARRPTLMNGQIAICASDLQLHINKTSGEAKSVKAVASMLHAVGAQNARVRGSKFRDQSRWLLPAAMFPPEEFSGARKDEAGPEGGAQQDA
jgi:hypothetical protein